MVLPYNSSLKQFQRIIKSSLNTKLVLKYNNTIARSLVKNSPAPLKAEGGVYSVSCSEYSDKYDETTKYVNARISQHKYDFKIKLLFGWVKVEPLARSLPWFLCIMLPWLPW